MTRGRDRNVAHLAADSVDEARRQWIAVFARDRADLGLTRAARQAVDDIERYGANARRPAHRAPRPQRPELDLGPRTPTVRAGPSIGL